MNGRVYDPTLGRFLTPDPYVQAPTLSQSWNRYSYVWNNPLRNTDPSGYLTSSTTSTEYAQEVQRNGKTPDVDVVESGPNGSTTITKGGAGTKTVQKKGSENTGTKTETKESTEQYQERMRKQLNCGCRTKGPDGAEKAEEGESRFNFNENSEGEAFPEELKAEFLEVMSEIYDDMPWGENEKVNVYYNPGYSKLKTLDAFAITQKSSKGNIEIVMGSVRSSGVRRSLIAEEVYHAADYTNGKLSKGMSQKTAYKGEVRAIDYVLKNRSKIRFSKSRKTFLENNLEKYKQLSN